MPYFIIAVTSIIGAFLYNSNKKIWNNILWYILLVVNIVVFGFRYRVGVDTLNYMYNFSYMPTLDDLSVSFLSETAVAPLFNILMCLCKTISNDFTLFQFVHSTFFNIVLFAFLKRYCTNPFLGFFVFFFTVGLYFNTEILKEGYAICMFLLGYKHLVNHNWKRYYLFAILSIGFHYGAVILLIMPLLQKLRLNKTLLFINLVFFLSLTTVMSFVLSNISNLALQERASYYEDMVGKGILNINYIIGHLLSICFVPLICLIFGRKCKNQVMQRMEPMLCAMVVFSLGVIYYQVMFQRFCNYFNIFMIVYFVNCLSERWRKSKIVCICLFCLVLAPSTYDYIKGSRLYIWFPYHSVFNPKEELQREQMTY